MEPIEISEEEMQKRIALLESLGFESIDGISKVKLEQFEFDFSASGFDLKNLVLSALLQVNNYAYEWGKQDCQQKFRDMMGIKVECGED